MTREQAQQKPFVSYPDGTKGRVIKTDDYGFTVRVAGAFVSVMGNGAGEFEHEWLEASYFTVFGRK